ncbi:hypothetical protein POM88_022343 [Heracleum sosnowskyi]|uniref:Uncharacterized protein n=1 Tax=Heracleum sosnowskyi TaxID=360622 RepID=A0AAD8IG96_9APIA|nr:hypothetical protein POM88_022343 [Heracleum sosnowskyi]
MAYNLRQAEARGSSVSNKKRKYPPSVWDGDDKAVFQFLQDGEIVDSPVEDGEIVDSPVEDGEIVDSPVEDDDVECGFWETPEPAAPVKRIVNMPQACRSVNEFEILKELGEGTYGVVYKGRNKKTGEIVALKKLKMDNHTEGFPLMSLREINILRSSDHPSIIDLKEVVEGSSTDCVFLVMEYMDSDLGAVTHTRRRKNRPFIESEVKCLMLQLLQGVKYLHDNLVLHRDLKTSNLLLNSRGELKICDLGMARKYGSLAKPYTQLVVTLWYRAPELLLGAKQYSTAVDMWSVGCIIAELLLNQPLFNGDNEIKQIDKIFRMLGTPNETSWPGFSELPGAKARFVKQPDNLLRKKFHAEYFTGAAPLTNAGFDLLNKLLTCDPAKRITADEALNHQWFREFPLPKSKDVFDQDNKYFTENYGLQDAKMGVLISVFPPVLQLQLMRFEYDFLRNAMVKINEHYEFPLKLDLDRENGNYVCFVIHDSFLYNSVLVHSGELHGGHYYAYIRPTLSQQWFEFNGEVVRKVDSKRALEDQYGGDEEFTQIPGLNHASFKFTKFSNTYMLVYIRESDKDKIICDVDEKEIAEHLRKRLKKEQEDKEYKRRYKAEAHLYTVIKVARDEDLLQQIGKDIHLDLVDFKKEEVAIEFGIQVQFQQYWIWEKRQNQTYRPTRPLTPHEEDQPHASKDKVCLRLKHLFLLFIRRNCLIPMWNSDCLNLEVFHNKIYKILEEEKNPGPHDRLINAYDFTKETADKQMRIQTFEEPFLLITHKGEILADVKMRIQKKLQVSDEEFSKV